eukprot:3486911-Rhodomonas_salina.1
MGRRKTAGVDSLCRGAPDRIIREELVSASGGGSSAARDANDYGWESSSLAERENQCDRHTPQSAVSERLGNSLAGAQPFAAELGSALNIQPLLKLFARSLNTLPCPCLQQLLVRFHPGCITLASAIADQRFARNAP